MIVDMDRLMKIMIMLSTTECCVLCILKFMLHADHMCDSIFGNVKTVPV